MFQPHPHVPHPRLLYTGKVRGTTVNDWLAQHLALIFGSVWTIWTFIVVPLVALLMPQGIQSVIFFLASGWVQLFALPLFVYVANKADAKREAKAETDHTAMTALHHKVDQLLAANGVPRPRGDRT